MMPATSVTHRFYRAHDASTERAVPDPFCLNRAMRASTWGSRPSFAQVRVLAILAGGAGGALARGGLQHAFPAGGGWPWGTFFANLAGTFLLGWLLTRLTERVAPTRLWRPFLGTGLSGALTTFSAFQVEAITLAKDGRPVLAAIYVLTSLTLGLMLAACASMLARSRRYG